MATSFSEIYNSFLDKITDTDLLTLSDSNRELFLNGLMESASGKFQGICLVDLTDKDEVVKQFNNTLSDEEIDIISTGMIVEWLKPKYFFNDNLKNSLNTKDYNTFSTANLLKEIRETYLNTKKEFTSMINKYSYLNGNIENLKPY